MMNQTTVFFDRVSRGHVARDRVSRDTNSEKPRIWVVTRHFGVDSQTWLWRQSTGFQRVDARVVCWARFNLDHYPIPSEKVNVVPFDEEPNDGAGRYLYRIGNLRRGNFYASAGDERHWWMDFARKEAPAAMLCHFGYSALRALPIAEARGIPLVAHFHGLDLSSGLNNKWYRWSLVRHLHRFAGVVVVGSHQRQWMLDRGLPENRVHLIPCGVPTGEFEPAARPHGREIRFITVSRLTEFKGVDYSMRAFAIVLQGFPSARMTIIGDGPEMPRLKELAVILGISRNVEILGSIPVSAVRQHMQDSDIFLQHSLVGRNGWVEGFGVSIAEAAACGLPVVVTNCGGILDQVVHGETGFVVAQRDIAGMASAMGRLASNPELRKRLGSAGRERMISLFDTSAQIEKLERVILAAVDSRRARARLRIAD